jgi:hypothetical protein
MGKGRGEMQDPLPPVADGDHIRLNSLDETVLS